MYWKLIICSFLQASDEAAKSIVAIKGILYGTADQEPQQEVIAQLSQEIYTSHVLKMIVQNLHRIDFEVSVWSKPNSSSKAGMVNVFYEKPTLKLPAKSGNQCFSHIIAHIIVHLPWSMIDGIGKKRQTTTIK